MAATLRRLREREQNTANSDDPYVNCDFIFGSAAQVEWLWSLAKSILTNQRSSLTPHLFEALLFLKVNKRFWEDNRALIREAIRVARHRATSGRVQELLNEEAAQVANLDLVDTSDDDDDDDDDDSSDVDNSQ